MALAYKPINKEEIYTEDRFAVEKDLKFLGFMILQNNLKKDTKEFMQQLYRAEQQLVILTGDHLLTSISTYNSLQINDKPCAILYVDDNKLKCKTLDEKDVPLTSIDSYSLTIIGQDLNWLL